jgi:hypothetical protein
VFVTKGVVTASVVGGYIRTASVDKIFALDASISSDAAVSPSLASTLAYEWTCTIGSIGSSINFATECGLFGNTTTITTSLFTLDANTMLTSITYTFLLVVTAPDGRSASREVSVLTVFSGAELEITSSFINFNVGEKLIINGFISADYAVTSEWSVFSSSGVAVAFTPLTPAIRNFSAIDAAALITYPLSADGSNFRGGNSYTFRLTVYPVTDSTVRTFSEIVLTVNSPPTGGSVSPTPAVGDALVTDFLIFTPGWTTDAASFPLTFSFDYQLTATSPSLTIATSSLRAFATTTLPAGLAAENYAITLNAEAADIFFSSASANSMVEVTMSQNTNVTKVLASSLLTAFSSGDVNLAFQTVNNVASTINIANCSAAPNCIDLNRYDCSMTRATCGNCFEWYSGVVGDANTQCHNNSTIIVGIDGTTCSVNQDCQYENCVSGICNSPSLACPSNDPGN